MRTAIITIIGCILSTSAYSACSPHGKFPNFSGDVVNLTQDTVDGSCGVNFHLSSNYNVMLKSLAVVTQPKHGLVTVNDFEFVYRAVRGYSGEDNFSIKVCADVSVSSGCSLVMTKVNISNPSTTDLTPKEFANINSRKNNKK